MSGQYSTTSTGGGSAIWTAATAARSLAVQTTMVTMYNVVEQASPLLLSLLTPKFEIEHRSEPALGRSEIENVSTVSEEGERSECSNYTIDLRSSPSFSYALLFLQFARAARGHDPAGRCGASAVDSGTDSFLPRPKLPDMEG